jgi:glyoxylase-like metal-dependent hydrolase (beta-lactamase superfamily II)
VIRIFALDCGWITMPRGLLLEGERGKVRVPVPAFLVEHPKGRVVFDTGVHPDAARRPETRLGELQRFFAVELGADDGVVPRLAALGVEASDVDRVVLSHLHFDHAGGLAALPNARLVVQRREWEAGRDADLRARNTYDARDFDLGHALELVDGEHDLFGDGRVVCLPTHGHTPGHQSLRVRQDGADVVLTADACYLRETLERRHLPPQAHDREGMLAALERFQALERAGARLVFGHDPAQWAALSRAPERLE